MVLRLKTLVLGFLVVFYCGAVAALGLGDIQLKSSLNEPMNAEIALHNIGEMSDVELLISLASREDFERAGVEREFYLVDLRFEADLSNPKAPKILVSSTKPIREPYLNFLVEVEWPAGRLLREYTLFLDLPIFASRKAAPQQSQVTATSTSTTPQQQQAGNAGESDAAAQDYRVRSGDTLWGLAARFRPAGSSQQQAMQAIYENNTAAFARGNMNVLKRGAILRVPTPEQVVAIDPEMARRQIAESAENLANRESVRELIGDFAEDTASQTDNTDEGMLSLSAANLGGDVRGTAAAGSSTSSGDENTEVLQNDLAIAQEELAKSTRENLELREKLSNLEEQLATMSRMVELEDDQLSAIQEGLRPESDSLPGDSVAMVEQDVATQAAGADVGASSGADTATPPVTPTADSAVSGVVSKSEAETGVFAALKNNLAIIASLILLVVLGILFLLARNRGDQDDSQLAPVGQTQQRQAVVKKPQREPTAAPLAAASADTEFVEAEDSGLEPVERTEVDPVGEADIYLSLGDYAEAEKVIQRALTGNPDEARLHLKLLDLYAAQDDAARFEAHYPKLVSIGDAEALRSAERLRGGLSESTAVDVGVLDSSATDDDDDYALELELPEENFDPETAAVDDTVDLAEEEALAELDLDLGATDKAVTEKVVEPGAGESEEADEITGDEKPAEEKSEFDAYDIDEDLDALLGGNEVATQLELAQAYIDMGDTDGARDILEDVMAAGDQAQQAKAQEIISQLS